MAKRRVPTWLKVTLGVFGVLFVLGAIVGRAASPANVTLSGTPAATPTTTLPPAATYAVTSVDGATLELTDATGGRRTVEAAGIETPAAGNCYAFETTSWATAFLTGKQVTMQTANSGNTTLAMIVLADGTNYSTIAVQTGHAKYVADAFSDAYRAGLQAAESAARAAKAGLWGLPCQGVIDAPAPVLTTQASVPVVQDPVTEAPAPETTTYAPDPTTEDVVFYPNCAAVKAAHAAPLHRGEPGYSRKLDRDGDGVACEK